MGEPVERTVLYFSLSGLVAGGALVAFSGGPHAHTAEGAGLLAATGLLATAGQWMITAAYGHGATLGVATLQYLGILFGFVFGVLVFDDPVTLMAVAGMALIVAAGVAATLLRGPPQARDAPRTEI